MRIKYAMRFSCILLFSWILLFGQLRAQSRAISILEAMQLAAKNNPQVLINNLEIEREKAFRPSAYQFNDAEILFEAPTGNVLRPGILQSFDFPTTYLLRNAVFSKQIQLKEVNKEVTINYLNYRVRSVCNDFLYYQQLSRQYVKQDSILQDLLKVSQLRFDVGQISLIEKVNAESQYRRLQYKVFQAKAELIKARNLLAFLIGNPMDTSIYVSDKFERLPHNIGLLVFDTLFPQNPLTIYYQKNLELNQLSLKLTKSQLLPRIVLGYLNQGTDNTEPIYRIRFGISLPLWYWFNPAKIKAGKKQVEISQREAAYSRYTLSGELQQALNGYTQFSEALRYFEEFGLAQSNQILAAANESYRIGSISYYNYLLNIQQAFEIQVSYLDALRNYNQSIIMLQYINAQ